MHGNLQKNIALLQRIKDSAEALPADLAVFPPFPYLAQVQSLLLGSAVSWGGQSVCEYQSGAYTGEVSADMLAEFGCRYVLVGHSERRSIYGESDEVVAMKFAMAQSAGLVPVLCLGETLMERERGDTARVVLRQLDAVVKQVGVSAMASAVVAYEPVWAIGSGLSASPDLAQDVHALIRSRVFGQDHVVASGLRILYGGSVKSHNAAELFGQADVDGALVGGASLVADEFLAICQAVK